MTDQTVAEIGEFGLISALRDALPLQARVNESLAVDIGDDAAVWTPTPGESLIVTTDSLIEGVHYRLDWTDWRSLGHKALAVNLSDIAAMGGAPRLAFVSLALTGTEQVADLKSLYEGIGAIALQYGVLVSGGDIAHSPSGTSITIAAIGETRGGKRLLRSGARPGDLIVVSGTLGASAAGLALLHMPSEDSRRSAATSGHLINAHLRPEPRIALGEALLVGGATSAMDLSDGLFGDLPKLLAASGVAARLQGQSIPVAAAVRALFPDGWFELATRGGEDYELLFTIPPGRFESLQSGTNQVSSSVIIIGIVVAASIDTPQMLLIGPDGNERPIVAGAWDHFRATP